MKTPIALLLFFGSLAASASELPIPKVAYTAEQEMSSAQGTFTSKIYHAGMKERAERQMEGMHMITILRKDRNVLWMLIPDERMYTETSLKQVPKGASMPTDVDITRVGKETIEGVSTTKYKMLLKDRTGGGFVWLDSHNIPVKMDVLAKDRGRNVRTTISLHNIKVGDQDPSLFEIPRGYSKMPAMGGGFPMGGFH